MSKLALQLPGFSGSIDEPGTPNFSAASGTTLGTVMSQFITLALFVAGFMMIFWLVWGAYEYILARGNKEALAKARNRIWWALLGFLILSMGTFLGQYAKSLYFHNGGTIPTTIHQICDPEKNAACP